MVGGFILFFVLAVCSFFVFVLLSMFVFNSPLLSVFNSSFAVLLETVLKFDFSVLFPVSLVVV